MRGRGGAGFNAGLKWTFVTPPDGGVRYLICNADEMEPGTFKDRLLMERLPFQLIEGMLIKVPMPLGRAWVMSLSVVNMS